MSPKQRRAFGYFASLTDRVYLPTNARAEVPVIPDHIGSGYGDLLFDVQAEPLELTPEQDDAQTAFLDQLLLDLGFQHPPKAKHED